MFLHAATIHALAGKIGNANTKPTHESGSVLFCVSLRGPQARGNLMLPYYNQLLRLPRRRSAPPRNDRRSTNCAAAFDCLCHCEGRQARGNLTQPSPSSLRSATSPGGRGKGELSILAVGRADSARRQDESVTTGGQGSGRPTQISQLPAF